MIEKLIDELVEEYTKNVVSSFKIVASKAYRDSVAIDSTVVYKVR